MSDAGRLGRLLGGVALTALRKRLRQRFELAGKDEPLARFRVSGLSAVEHAALANLQGKSARAAASMEIDVSRIDSALREAGIADSLRAALETLDGPIVYRAAEREILQRAWQRLCEVSRHPALLKYLATANGVAVLKRLAKQNVENAASLLTAAEAVLQRLPARGITRSRLAADALGDAHALDGNRPIASFLLAVLRSEAMQGLTLAVENDTLDVRVREIWASVGVLVNELARPALALNLPGVGTLGEPTYLSLRSLVRAPLAWPVMGQHIFVCENPNLLAIAADELAASCAPMVCTEGMPAAAQRTLLQQLAAAGATLHYHGDFDWPGIAIGNHVIGEFGALPWRFGAKDYAAALVIAPTPGRLLTGVVTEALWDAALGAAMRAAARVIEEEMVADDLLRDLRERVM